MDLLFLGSSSFPIPFINALHESSHRLLAVITRPDRPSGRGLEVRPSAVKKFCQEKGISLLQPSSVNEKNFLGYLVSLRPDLLVVVAYGEILRPELLAIPPRGSVNVHASLLPKYRGPSPIETAIMEGEARTGITTMLITPALDEGDIFLQREVEILSHETAGDLYEKLMQIGPPLLLETVEGIAQGTLVPVPQDHSQATYTAKITPQMANIDWQQEARRIHDLIRALNPRPGARTALRGNIIKIWGSQVIGQDKYATKGPAEPGSVVGTSSPEGLIVATGEDFLRITELQPVGRKRMRGEDFIRGYHVQVGDRFEKTPLKLDMPVVKDLCYPPREK
ncbi:methionyl-tRNA formyltransferase [Candidatus Hakubella thermalkaliphila]|uniref:Methionyl-tRNA formyltransferase n=2 Tax=Candidatus Hakubella thermalkaliphila TaxID=2754717 RepID=A0A6V8NK94_9ACTN|nr:methionyl-tRNA formyltransferase [Candidatus Hakubella thermalkaliphila]GFP19710.1 methionyl-tRNA formyltransferase [Candidatus Hakubella thermalkaliphila]GFP30060.1 methionyl-tRNA formyltransferase [Candidatus Hakubella thermalkaliphila]